MLIIEKEYCTGCKLCEKNCPTGAIRVIGRKAKINSNICDDCYRCVYICPTTAIKETALLKGKTSFPNKGDSKELSGELIYLKKKLSRIEKILSKIESERR